MSQNSCFQVCQTTFQVVRDLFRSVFKSSMPSFRSSMPSFRLAFRSAWPPFTFFWVSSILLKILYSPALKSSRPTPPLAAPLAVLHPLQLGGCTEGGCFCLWWCGALAIVGLYLETVSEAAALLLLWLLLPSLSSSCCVLSSMCCVEAKNCKETGQIAAK